MGAQRRARQPGDEARRFPRRQHHRAAAIALVLALSLLGTGCDRGSASDLDPSFAGVWDVTYDDNIEVEVWEDATRVLHGRIGEQGGAISAQDAGVGQDVEIDCARPDLICPSEVWSRELSLKHAPGDLDGAQLAEALAGRGEGRCRALAGSFLSGEVLTTTGVHSARSEAVAITSGRAQVRLDARCLGAALGLAEGAQVVLTTGFTAAKR